MATSLAFEWRRHAAAMELAPWLLLSALLHGVLVQLAPLGSSWNCCGDQASPSRPVATQPMLSIRLDGATAKAAGQVRTLEPAKATAGAAALQDRVASTDNGLLPYYHPPGELSAKPQAATEIRLADTEALADVQSGSLVLELFINETGRLDRVRVESGSLPESFQEIVAETFRQALFTPGMKNHIPVKSRLRIEVAVEDVLETTRTRDSGATAI